jgi:hypothetical protein
VVGSGEASGMRSAIAAFALARARKCFARRFASSLGCSSLGRKTGFGRSAVDLALPSYACSHFPLLMLRFSGARRSSRGWPVKYAGFTRSARSASAKRRRHWPSRSSVGVPNVGCSSLLLNDFFNLFPLRISLLNECTQSLCGFFAR